MIDMLSRLFFIGIPNKYFFGKNLVNLNKQQTPKYSKIKIQKQMQYWNISIQLEFNVNGIPSKTIVGQRL